MAKQKKENKYLIPAVAIVIAVIVLFLLTQKTYPSDSQTLPPASGYPSNQNPIDTARAAQECTTQDFSSKVCSIKLSINSATKEVSIINSGSKTIKAGQISLFIYVVSSNPLATNSKSLNPTESEEIVLTDLSCNGNGRVRAFTPSGYVEAAC